MAEFGIQTISNPADADMDIWFVHGLTSNRETTWTHPNGTFTPDLVRAQFPTARVVSYGYDANVVGLWKNASGEGLRGHGKALAYAIANSRPNEAKRPLFFIAHSLGGLVTEQALLVSLEPNEPRLQSIAPCTAGIVFLGTPHSGSYLAMWGYTLARLLDRFWRTNKELLSLLKQRSEVLKAVEEVFQRKLTADGALKHVKIFCFYETVAVDVVGFVVPEESATMLPHPNCGIDANHMDMTKFTSLHDAGFIGIKGVLDDWIKRAKEQKTPETNAEAKDVASTAKALGKEHPSTLTSVGNLAGVLWYQGKYEAAKAMNRRALEGREKALGKEHPDTLTSVYCLAFLLHQQHRYDDASALYKRASSSYQHVLGAEHPTTVACFKHYSSLLQDIERSL